MKSNMKKLVVLFLVATFIFFNYTFVMASSEEPNLVSRSCNFVR